MLNDNDRRHAVALMTRASTVFSDHGCNDFPVPNTDDNWDLAERVGAWNLGITVEQYRRHRDYDPRPSGKTIFLIDWLLMHYFADRLNTGD